MTTGAGGGVGVIAVIVGCGGGGVAIWISGGGMKGGGGASSLGGGGSTTSGGGGGFLISSITLVSIGARMTSTTSLGETGDERVDDQGMEQHDHRQADEMPARIGLPLGEIH